MSRIVSFADDYSTPQNNLTSQPTLPKCLDELISQPWNPENSLAVDRWLAYFVMEFEVKS